MEKSYLRMKLSVQAGFRSRNMITSVVMAFILTIAMLTPLQAASPCAPALTGLVGWWSGDGHANDLSGNGYHGTASSVVSYQDGVVGPGMRFDGLNGIVSVGMLNNTALNESSPFTITGWINTISTTPQQVIAGNNMAEAAAGGPYFSTRFVVDSGQLSFAVNKSQVLDDNITTPITTGWHYVSAAYDGTNLTLYVDGQLKSSGTRSFSGAMDNTRGWTIGDSSPAGAPFNGLIDELQIFNRALSASEVIALYSTGGAGVCKAGTSPAPSLNGWWPGNMDATDVISGNNGTLLNGATFAQGVAGTAFKLDGVDDFVRTGQTSLSGGGQTTYSAWIYPEIEPASGYSALLGVGDATTSSWDTRQCRLLYFGGPPRFYMDCGVDGGQFYQARYTAGNYPPNSWYHVAGVFNNGVVDLYVNGVLDNGTIESNTTGGSITNSVDKYLWIGGQSPLNSPASSSENFKGIIDEVQIASRALSAAEIKATVDAGSAGTARCVQPVSGMIARWPGDNSAADIAGSYNGTLTGSAGYAAGKVGQAFNFDGVSGYLDNGTVDLAATFTVNAWINPNNLLGTQTIVSKDDGISLRSYSLGFDLGGMLFASVRNDLGGYTQYRTNAVVLTAGSWNHVALTYDGNAAADQKFRFLVNGVPVPAAHIVSYDDGGSPAIAALSLKTGIGGDGVTAPFNGLIDEIQLYNRILADSEIAAIFAADQTGVCKSADLVITNSCTPEPVFAGDVISCTLTVTNSGPFNAPNVVVVDPLAGFNISAYMFTSGAGFCTAAAGVGTCTLGDMASGTSSVATITATAAAVTSQVVYNASAVVGSAGFDPASGNDAAAYTITIDPPPQLFSVSWSAADFGSVSVGTFSAARQLLVSNTGSVNLVLSPVTLTGADAGEFTIASSSCDNQSIVAGGSCLVNVKFKPTTIGIKNAALSISSPYVGAPLATPALTGKGGDLLLTVTRSGVGKIIGAGIECGTDCTEPFENGTVVTLTAVPSPGATFTAWSDPGCPGTGDCTFTMTANTAINATFTAPISTGVSFSAGFQHSAEVRFDGTLWAWGRNDYGQLGDGSVTQRSIATQEATHATDWALVTAGEIYSLAIKKNGTLWSWGYNSEGALGDGTNGDRSTPGKVNNDTDWAYVAAGWRHVVALKTDGTLWAWGNNGRGQLGDGTTTHRNVPVQVGIGSTWKAVSAGYEHTVAIRADGTAWAWGRNDEGELGYGYTDSGRTSPTQVGSDSNWSKIAASGYHHNLGIKTDGTLWAWGYRSYSQVGDGNPGVWGWGYVQPLPTQITLDTDWVAVSAGGEHSLALKASGTLWAWGRNYEGQLGLGGADELRQYPTQVGSDTDWAAISAGLYFSMAQKANGELWRWGQNNYGQLGNGSTSDNGNPVKLAPTIQLSHNASDLGSAAIGASTPAKQIFIYNLGTDILRIQTLSFSGTNAAEFTISGDTCSNTVLSPASQCTAFITLTPAAAGPLSATLNVPSDDPANLNATIALTGKGGDYSLTVSKVGVGLVTGSGINCGLDCSEAVAAGAVVILNATPSAGVTFAGWSGVICENPADPAGVCTVTINSNTTVTATFTASGYIGSSFSAGGSHNAEVRFDGTLWTWGSNSYGQLGLGDTTDRSTATKVGIDSDWAFVSVGDIHSLAIKKNGTLWAWGYNNEGALGNGTTSNSSVPAQIGTAADWTFVSAGYRHTAAIKADGTLWTWGYNGNGQLGDGTTLNRNMPIQVGIGDSWKTVSAAGYGDFTLAVRSDGTLWGMGRNYEDQLGQGGTDWGRVWPTQIGTDANWSKVSGMHQHAEAIKSDGTLWAWGYDGANWSRGRLGIDVGFWTENYYQAIPGQVGADTNWADVSTGIHHTLARKTDGTIWAWGSRQYAQVGDGGIGTDYWYSARVLPLQIGSGNTWSAISAGGYHNIAQAGDGTLWLWGNNDNGRLGHTNIADITNYSPVQMAPDIQLSVQSLNLGSIVVGGASSAKQVQVYNKGGDTLQISAVTLTGADFGEFELQADSCTGQGVLPYSQCSFNVVLKATTAGVKNAVVTIASNDLDTPIASLPLTGKGGNLTLTVTKAGTGLVTGSGISCGLDCTEAFVSGDSVILTATQSAGVTFAGWSGVTCENPADPANVCTFTMSANSTVNATFTAPAYIGTSFAAGGAHNAEVKFDGTLWTWGYNNYGQLGVNDTTDRSTATKVGSDSDWDFVSVGDLHTLAIKKNGTLWTWGLNDNGQLGNNSIINSSVPVQVGTDTDWSYVAAGYRSTVALKIDGTLWSWGYNVYGQLGDDTTQNRIVPTQIGIGSTWKEVSISENGNTTIAIRSDGTLWSWGYNAEGELGNGTTGGNTVWPGQVGTDTNWNKISVGAQHALALKADGSLWAWGFDGNGWNRGRLGADYGFWADGYVQNSPLQINGDTNWSAVSAGTHHTLALKNDGTLWSWGSRQYAQVGDGWIGTDYWSHARLTPLQIGVGTTWSAINSGAYHNIAQASDGMFWLWGNNDNGRLGNGGIVNITNYYPVMMAPKLQVSRTAIDLGSASLNSASPAQKLFVYNQGTDNLLIDSVLLGGADPGQFVILSDACSGQSVAPASPCLVTLALLPTSTGPKTAALNITSNDQINPLTTVVLSGKGGSFLLSVTKTGEGAVDGTGIACGDDCTESYSSGAAVTLNATAAPGFTFSGWSGACSGVDPCTLSITADTNVAAIFTAHDQVVTSFAAGHYFSAEVRSDGTLWTWGYNGNGQLGDGTTINRFWPLQIGTDHDWKLVATGHEHAMAIKKDGSLWGWGYNGYGQIGNGNTNIQLSPARIGTDSDWAFVTGGNNHTVALKTDGTLWTWGYNAQGQLGDGTISDRFAPLQTGLGFTWKKAVAGENHTVGVRSDGTLWAWGYNGYGELGDATNTDRVWPVQAGTESNWVTVSAGAYHTLAIKDDGTLWGMGLNEGSRLTLNDCSGWSSNVLIQIGTDSNWKALASGDAHNVALKTDGSLWGWGHNDYGQLGTGNTTWCQGISRVGSANDWVGVATGGWHTLAQKSDGMLWLWGRNDYGQLGNGGVQDITIYSPKRQASNIVVSVPSVDLGSTSVGLKTPSSPVIVYNKGGNVLNLSAVIITGANAAEFAITADSCSGSGVYPDGNCTLWVAMTPAFVGAKSAMLEISSNDTESSKVAVSLSGKGGDLLLTVAKNGLGAVSGPGINCGPDCSESFVSGDTVTLNAIALEGAIFTGWSGAGCSGVSPACTVTMTASVTVSANFASSNNVNRSFSAGEYHSAEVRSDGTLWMWGNNDSGQLGIGDNIAKWSPIQVGTDADWVEVAAGYRHTVAIKTDGTLWAWGLNDTGQVGKGEGGLQYIPVRIGGDSDWSTVSAGNHTVALKKDGTLWTWGYNGYGQLGNGTITNRWSPVQVAVGQTWNTAVAGVNHTVAIRIDGTLWTWGYNGYGQLGNNSATDQYLPIQIGTDSNWTKIAGGYNHTLALKSDNTLWAWGYNGNGELGLGYAGGNVLAPTHAELAGTASGDMHLTLWHWRNAYSTPYPVSGSTFANGLFVAVGQNGLIRTSADGTVWNDRASGTIENLSGITFGNGIFVAVGSNGAALTSTDAITWTVGSTGNGEGLAAVAFGNSLFVATGLSGAVVTSSDGIVWTAISTGRTEDLKGVVFGNNRFVAVGSGIAISSPDGSNWTAGTASGNLNSVTFGNNIYVAVGDAGSILTSTDGNAWTSRVSGVVVPLFGVSFGNNSFVAAGDNNTVVTSTNGTGWISSVRTWDMNWNYGLSNGLVGRYYNDYFYYNNGFDAVAAPDAVQLDLSPSMNWCGANPSFPISADGYWSADWNGYVNIPAPGSYSFRTEDAYGLSRIYVNGVSLGTSGAIAFAAAGKVPITVKFVEMWGGNCSLNLYWTPDGGSEEIVPSSVLFPTLPSASAFRGVTFGNNSFVAMGDAGRILQSDYSASYKDVSAGENHTLAVKQDGSLWSWGYNGYGQLGDGTTNSTGTPVRIGVDSDWVAVAAGGYYSIAQKSDGVLWLWGQNNYGQLANGTNVNISVPVRQAGIPPVGSILINAGAPYTNNSSVTLTLTCSGNGACTEMQLKDSDMPWQSVELFAASKVWILSMPDADKVVSVRFKDTAGLWSDTLSASILLDTTKPVVTASPAGGTSALERNVVLAADEPAIIYYTTNGANPDTSSLVYTTPIVVTSDMAIKFFAADLHGNSSDVVTENYIYLTPKTVTPSATGGGSIAPNLPQSVIHNTSTSFALTPDDHHHFVSVSGCSGTLAGTTYTTGNVTADCAVAALFAIDSVTVSATAGTNGSLSVATPSPVNVDYNSVAQFTFTAATGYHLAAISGCGVSYTNTVNGVTTYTATTSPVTAACTVDATFAIDTHTVSATAGQYGSVTPASQTVNYNSNGVITLTSYPNHHIAAVSGSCGGSLAGNTYTTAQVTADCTVAASFTIDTYAVTPSAGANGAVTPATVQTVDYGGVTSFTITPETGYNIVSVAGCGGALSGNVYTTGELSGDCQVSAVFNQSTFNVTGNVIGGNGGISCVSPVTGGTNSSCTITPATGYHLLSLTDNGVDMTTSVSGSSYALNAVVMNHYVKAVFAINPYTVTPGAGANGSITPATAQTVTYGNTSNFTVTAATGYHINTVTGCNGVLSGNSYTTGAVTADCSVAASFAIDSYPVSATAGANGVLSAATPSPATVNYGSTASFTFDAATGHHVASVTGCGVNYSNSLNSVKSYSAVTAAVTGACSIAAAFAIDSHIVTAPSVEFGSITPAGSVSVNHGSSAIFTVTPAAHYHITSVSGCGGTLAGNSFTTAAITADCTLSAGYAADTYTITPTAGTNGSVTPSAAQTINYGSVTSFTVTPANGFTVASATGCGGALSGSNYTTAPATADCSVAVTFTPITYTVDVTVPGGNGSIICSTPVNHGDNSACIITPNSGYQLNVLTDNGSSVIGSVSANSYTIANVTADHILSATFTLNSYTVTTNAGIGGSISPVNPTVSHGNAATLTVSPAVGYAIVSVTGCGGTLSGNAYTTGALSGSCTVSASFQLDTENVTASVVGGNGAINCQSPVNYGSGSVCTITPASGYKLAGLTDNGIDFTAAVLTNSYTLSNVVINHDVVASFIPIPYTVTPNVGAHGAITPATAQTVEYGGTQLFTIAPDPGYSIVSATGCGGTLNGNAYTTGTITGDCQVSVSFQVNVMNITAAVIGSHGNVSCQTPVDYGTASVCTITPAQGYHLSGLTDNGSDVLAAVTAGSYSLNSITTDHSVSAVFAPDSYTVTPGAGANGSISPATAQTVTYGNTSNFTVTAATGYHINTVTGCNGILSGNSYTTGAVTADCSVAASFAIDTFVVNFAAGANGTIAPTGSQTVNYGANTTAVTATAGTGYHFVNWTTPDGFATTANPLTLTNVIAAQNYTANFAVNNYTVIFTTSGSGSLTGSTVQTVNSGANATQVTAVPAIGQHFVNWTGTGGFVATTANPLTVANVTTAQTITANFAADNVIITFTTSGSGSLIGSASQTVNYGADTAEVTAVPAIGQHFVNWTGTGGFVATTANPLTVTNVTTSWTITANFAVNSYTIDPTIPGGNGAVSCTSPVNHGDNSACTISPNSGYQLNVLTDNGSSVIGSVSANSYTIANVTADHILSGTFTLNSYTVTTNAGTGGSISPVNPTVSHGNAATLTVSPAVGYAIVSVTGCGGTLSGNAYTTGALSGSCTVSASFQLDTENVTASVIGGNGAISCQSPVNYGSGSVCTITPANGYKLAGLTDNGIDFTAAVLTNSYTLSNVVINHDVVASFIPVPYTVTPGAGANGSISPATAQTVTYGNTSNFTVTAATGYHINTVTGCNGVLSGNSYTTGAVTADCSVAASFAIDTFVVNFAAGANGSLSGGSASQTVNYGANAAAVTAVPATGYHFVNWTTPAGFITTANPLVVTSVTAAQGYTANFSIDNFAVTFAASGSGYLTGTASQTINYNASTAPITAVPAVGYHFVNWTGTGGFVTTTANPLTVANVKAAQNITANFAIDGFNVNFATVGNGTLTGTISQIVFYSASTTPVIAVPATGYHFVNWTGIGGLFTSTANPLTVANVTAAQNITANFAVDTFNVNFASGGNGTVTGAANQTINYNAATTPVTAVPAAGYHFVNWTGTGGFVASTVNPLTVVNVKAAQNITANFAISAIIITKDASKPFAYTAGRGILSFTAPASVSIENIKATMSADPWITIDLANVKFVKGKGSVPYTVAMNADPVPRSGMIFVAGDSYAINQAAHPCVITSVVINPLTPIPATGGEQSVTVNVEPNSCQWKIASYKISRDVWFSAAGNFPAVETLLSGDQTLQGSLPANTTKKARVNTIVISTADGKSKKSITLKQAK